MQQGCLQLYIPSPPRDFSNTMIGHYKLDCNGHEGSVPTLYMVAANNLVAPTVGIRDVGRSEGSRVEA